MNEKLPKIRLQWTFLMHIQNNLTWTCMHTGKNNKNQTNKKLSQHSEKYVQETHGHRCFLYGHVWAIANVAMFGQCFECSFCKFLPAATLLAVCHKHPNPCQWFLYLYISSNVPINCLVNHLPTCSITQHCHIWAICKTLTFLDNMYNMAMFGQHVQHALNCGLPCSKSIHLCVDKKGNPLAAW